MHRFIAALFAALFLASCATLPPSATVPSSGCRTKPLAGVYKPWRLHLIAPCLTVSGVIEHVRSEPDHDYHLNLKLDPGSPHLTNWVNRTWTKGYLVLEVIPMDQGSVPIPAVGEHVTVTGAYVLDLIHGWREIHPVWMINGVGSAGFTESAARKSVAIGNGRD